MKTKNGNTNLTSYSQSLRRNMTKEERHLWFDFLKNLDITVHRQHIIGEYIADFYIASKSIVIELDGGGHFETEQIEYDRKRDAYMNAKGITVIRYSNADIHNNFSGVCEDILIRLGLLQE